MHFRVQRSFVLFAALGVVSCAGGTAVPSSTSSSASSRTEYYYGTSTVTSPDGKIPYGSPSVLLLRREVEPGSDQILEVRFQGGREVTTVLRRDRGSVFRASATDGSLSGSVTFAGADWQWQRWTYAYRSGDTRFEGIGEFDGDWRETVTYEVGASGDRRKRTTDRLVKITREEYDRRHSQMMTASTTSRRR